MGIVLILLFIVHILMHASMLLTILKHNIRLVKLDKLFKIGSGILAVVLAFAACWHLSVEMGEAG